MGHDHFRPVDLQFGPDGALYVVDWHNALIGHLQHNLREPNRDHSHGRIWRVTYKGRPLVKPPKIHGAAVPDLLEHLKLPEYRTRYRVRRELAARETDSVIPDVKKWIKGLDSPDPNHELHMMEALWLFQTHNQINRDLLERILNSKDYQARAAAKRVLSYWFPRVPGAVDLLKKRINDESGLVRDEAVRAASFFPPEEITEAVLDVLNYDMDENLEYLLEETLKALEAN